MAFAMICPTISAEAWPEKAEFLLAARIFIKRSSEVERSALGFSSLDSV